jgi:hypothetical protein
MDGSRADRRFFAAAALLPSLLLVAVTPAAAVSAAEPSAAQEGPVRLMPRHDRPRQRQAPAQPTPDTRTMPPDIQVQDLGTVDPESVGTIDGTSGGLGAGMWEGMPRSTLRRLVAGIPSSIQSAVMRSLAERLLLTAAALPPLAEGEEPGKPSMLALRAGRLQAMGRVEAAKALILASPLRARDPDLVRLLVDNRFLANDIGGACSESKKGAGRPITPYWQKVAIFCQLLAGENEAAVLGANILAESPKFDDKAFLALVDALAEDRSVEIQSLPDPTALHLAMLRSVNAPIPPDTVENAAPDVLRSIGTSPNADLDLRLRAAERAAQAGAIGMPRLAQIYMSLDFSDDELNNALSKAAENWTPRGRALLYRAARMQTVPTAKAAVVKKAFELAQSDGQQLLQVGLYGDILKSVPVSADLAWFAGDAAKGLLALGDQAGAQPWLTLLRQRQFRDHDARTARDRLWALALLAGDSRYSDDDTAAMDAYYSALREQDPELASEHAGYALVLLQAIGLPIPEGYWHRVLDAPKPVPALVPPPAFVPALENAVRAGRLGEVVLLTILMLGPDGTLDAPSATLRDVIAALRSVGLENEGRALALEAALTNGI